MTPSNAATRWTERQQGLRVVILYHDLVAGKRAMRVLSMLGRGLGDGIEFQPCPWSFELLTDASWCDVAAVDALEAEVVMIATSDPNGLPRPVEQWVKWILNRKRGTEAAVIALFGTDETPQAHGASAVAALRRVAQREGLVFFAPPAPGDLGRAFQLYERPERVTSLLQEILGQQRATSHWGIND